MSSFSDSCYRLWKHLEKTISDVIGCADKCYNIHWLVEVSFSYGSVIYRLEMKNKHWFIRLYHIYKLVTEIILIANQDL